MTNPLGGHLEALQGNGSLSNLARPPSLAPIDWSVFWTDVAPDHDWLIEPVVPAGRQVAIFSPAKAGKSLLALDVAAAAATGRTILGGASVEPVDVVYMDYEMTEEDLRERIEDLGYGPDSDLSRLHYYLLPLLPALNTPAGGQVFEAIVSRHCARLVVLDTMARVVQGEENSSDTYRDFYRFSGQMLKATGCALLRLDHAGKDREQGQRGSSAKNDDVDVVFELTAKGNAVTLKRTLSRVQWVPAEIRLERREDPLSHVLVDQVLPTGTAEIADDLTRLGVPLDATVDVAQDVLREAGKGRRRATVVAALKLRKQRG